MNEPTDFGAIIRELMISPKITQKELAEKLGVSDGILSNYLTGKNVPEMNFLDKCIKYFGIKKKGDDKGVDIKNFFYKTFLSAANHNKKIIVDTKFLDSTRMEMLTKVITVFLLYPKLYKNYKQNKHINILGEQIEDFFKALDDNIEYYHPAD